MRITKKIVGMLALLAMVPLAAQVPVSGPVADLDIEADADATGDGPGVPVESAPLERADVEAWLDGFLPYALERGEIAGAVVVVVQGGETLLQKGYGYADIAEREPVDPETTLFRPGSVTKLITWTAVMQQVEEGAIELDADVNTYLDFEIPAYDGEPITMRDIMTHTPGFEESIRHLISDDPAAVMSLEEYARDALPTRIFAPGTTPAYSNYATALAGRIVEITSGMNFDDYVDERIFAPLGMEYATMRQPLPDQLASYMSQGYSTMSQPARPFEIVVPAPAGSLSASGAAMARFMQAHLADGEGVLQPETTQQMHDFRAPNVGPLNTMALGFYEQWINGHRAIGHGGDTGLFHSYLWLFPDEDIGLYISMNSSGAAGAAQAVRSALFQKFAERYLPGDTDFTPIDADTAREHAQMLAGYYEMSRGSRTNFLSMLALLSPYEVVVGSEGQIMVPALDGLSAGPRDWVEVEPFIWRDRLTGERLAAEVEDGRVTRFSIDTFSPFTVMEPARAGVNPGWLLPVIMAALALVLLAALAWPVRALVRRHYKADFALSGRALTVYRATRVCAWLVLLALAGWFGLVAAFSSDTGALGGDLDWLLILLRIVTPIATIGLLVAAAWHLWNCFRDSRRWTMKLGAALLVFAGLVLVWVTIRFHLYGFSLVY